MNKLAGKKIKRQLDFQGLPISIEYEAGDTRKDHAMHYTYGYIRCTTGADNEALDVYVGPSTNADSVYWVTQLGGPEFKDFDEHKVMVGFSDMKAAKSAYLRQYPKKFFGGIREQSMTDFKTELGITKTAESRKIEAIANHVDDVGIGLLAAPYAASAIGEGLEHVSNPRAKAVGEAISRFAGVNSGFGKSHIREIAGLGLVAPGITHRVAKGIHAGQEKLALSMPSLGGLRNVLGRVVGGAERQALGTAGTMLARPGAIAGGAAAANAIEKPVAAQAAKTFAGVGGPAVIPAQGGKTLAGVGGPKRVVAPGMEAEHAAWQQRQQAFSNRVNATVRTPASGTPATPPVAVRGTQVGAPPSAQQLAQIPAPVNQTQVGVPRAPQLAAQGRQPQPGAMAQLSKDIKGIPQFIQEVRGAGPQVNAAVGKAINPVMAPLNDISKGLHVPTPARGIPSPTPAVASPAAAGVASNPVTTPKAAVPTPAPAAAGGVPSPVLAGPPPIPPGSGKPLIGWGTVAKAGLIGATGLGLYGGMRGADAIAGLAGQQHASQGYYGIQPGQQPIGV